MASIGDRSHEHINDVADAAFCVTRSKFVHRVVPVGIDTELEAPSEHVDNIMCKPDAICRLIVTWESPRRQLKQARCDDELPASN